MITESNMVFRNKNIWEKFNSYIGTRYGEWYHLFFCNRFGDARDQCPMATLSVKDEFVEETTPEVGSHPEDSESQGLFS